MKLESGTIKIHEDEDNELGLFLPYQSSKTAVTWDSSLGIPV